MPSAHDLAVYPGRFYRVLWDHRSNRATILPELLIFIIQPLYPILVRRQQVQANRRRLVGELRPDIVVVENVTALLGRGIDRVLGCLAARGYDAEWDCIPAVALGAPHERDRVFIVAYPAQTQRRPILGRGNLARAHRILADRAQDAGRTSKLPQAAWDRPWREVADELRRMDDGLAKGFHGYNGCANAVVPQIPELIGRAILKAEGLTP